MITQRQQIHLIGSFALMAVLLGGCATPDAGEGKSLCPGTPAGIPVDGDGCPLYSDADSVADYQDKCTDTAPGIAVDANGCPRDTDTDGAGDNQDACSSTPIGVRVDARGCPLTGERIAIVTNINFDFNQSNVRESVRNRFSRVIQILKEMPEIHVQIVGYTDDVGSAQYNLILSVRRAEAVRDYISARGVDAARLSTAGRGESQPLVSNSTPEGRAVNRRVEFVVQ